MRAAPHIAMRTRVRAAPLIAPGLYTGPCFVCGMMLTNVRIELNADGSFSYACPHCVCPHCAERKMHALPGPSPAA